MTDQMISRNTLLEICYEIIKLIQLYMFILSNFNCTELIKSIIEKEDTST